MQAPPVAQDTTSTLSNEYIKNACPGVQLPKTGAIQRLLRPTPEAPVPVPCSLLPEQLLGGRASMIMMKQQRCQGAVICYGLLSWISLPGVVQDDTLARGPGNLAVESSMKLYDL